uniref:patatin-like phospholipase family protein n=1 Tax=Thaumasiovibrio occultus TaxID=1891184 RepID=UPI000B361078|nr:patatin-like phospholipase family protein [Thaumasiovibrio occultus]
MIKKGRLFSTFLATSLIIFPVQARETVGLVLSGGGAKGAAHIGVLEILEENRIPIDIVTGTSMGAYVGGMYAMGLSAEEVKQRTFSVNWIEGTHDSVSREALSLRRKEQADDYQLRTELGIDLDGSFKSIPAVFQGHAMARILRQMTQNIPVIESFETLPIPFRAVATDIATVTPYVLDNGSLPLAMQASMTVPGALKPVEWQGHLLVDGGIVNNMPVDQALDLGAERIIAVDLRDALYPKDELNSGFNIANQLITHMTNLGSDEQMALLTLDDVYLQPDVTYMTATSFEQMDKAYEAGRQVALNLLPELLPLQVSEQEYAEYQREKLSKRAQLFDNSAFFVDEIRIVNRTRYSDEALLALLDLPLGQVLTAEEIEAGVNRLYARDIYDRITYAIEVDDGHNILNVEVNEKVWGPGYLNFKFAIEDVATQRSEFSVGAQYLYTGLSDKGAEWLTEMELGSWNTFYSEIYVPWDHSQLFYSTLGLSWQNEFRRFSFSDELPPSGLDIPYYDVEYDHYETFFESGINLTPSTKLALGATAYRGEYKVELLGERQTAKGHHGYLTFISDKLDDYFFPSTGHYFDVTLGVGRVDSKFMGQREEQDTFFYHTQLIQPWRYQDHTLVAMLSAGGSESEESLPVYARDLGGLFNLSGYNRYELNGRYSAIGVLKYKYQLFNIDYGFVKSRLFVGGSLERGNVWQSKDAISFDSMLTAGSVFIGADSVLGPMYLGYGQVEDGSSAVYFSLGSHF